MSHFEMVTLVGVRRREKAVENRGFSQAGSSFGIEALDLSSRFCF